MSIKTAQPSLLSIHEAALLLKVSTKTLRRWEAKNILVPERTEGKHRRYRFEAIANLKKTKSKVLSNSQAISHKAVIERAFIPASNDTVEAPITPQQFFESNITNAEQNLYVPKKTGSRKSRKIFARVLFVLGLFIITATSAQAFGLQIKKLFSIDNSNPELINPAKVLADTTALQDLHFDINVPTKINADLIVTGNATASGNLSTAGNLTVEGTNNNIAGILTLTGNTLSATADLTINPLGGGVRIGTTGTPAINLAGGDLFVSDQLQVGTSITLGGDSITDFVGTGLSLVNGVLQSTIGTTVEGSEIADNTINEAKLTVSNDASNGKLLSYNSSTGGFTWIDQAPNTSPFQTTSNVANLVTSTDDVTVGAATDLGKLAIVGDSDETQLLARGGSTQTAKIFDVQNSAATSLFSVDNTGNLITSGSLTLNSDTISDFTGNGLTLSSGSLTISLVTATDGLSSTTSNGSGLEVLSSGLSLIQGCGDGQLLKWSESADTWGCASDSGATSAVINVKNNGVAVGTNVDTVNFTTDFTVTESPSGTDNIAVADDILNFSEFSDTLTLDASTSIAFGASNLSFTFTNNGSANEIHNLSSTGDLVVQDNGTTFATFDDAGGITLAPNGTSDVTLTLDSDSTLTLTGVQASTGSALCLDGSNNVVTCTTGTGGIAGSGTSGQIAFFNGSTSITSETSGFGWDATNNLLTVTSATTTSVANTFTDDSITSGKLALFTTASTVFTGNLVDITSTGGNASNTGNILHVQAAASDAVVAAVITNLGSGTSFRVNDQTGDSDATPFIVDNAGNVGIGDPSPASLLTVGAGDVFQVNSSGAIAAATGITSSGTILFSGLGTGYVKSTSGTLSVSATVATTDLSGTLFSTTADSGSSTVIQGDTVAVNGGTNGVDTSLSGDTYTVNLDTTEIGSTTFGSGSGFTWTFDASAGTDTTLAFGNNSATFTGNTFTVASSTTNADSIALVPQNSTATNSFTGTITSADLTAARTWTLPDDTGTICLTTGNCAGSGGGITGSGATGQVAYFSGSGTITSVAGFAWDTTTGQLTLASTTSNADKLALLGNATGSNTFTGSVTVADLTAARTYTLPDQSGTVCLTSGNCTGVGGSMGSFNLAGDSGSDAVADAQTATIAGGTNGIDTSETGRTVTVNLDTTEIGDTTFGSGSGFTWTFNAGATDPTIAFASDQITIGSASTLSATGVTTFNCTDCINFDDMADSMTLDASTSIATGNSLGLTVTSDISGGARSTDVVTISQASDVTNSSTGNLLQLTNSDSSSTAALLSINQSSGGTGINFENYPGGSGVGINFTNNGSSIGTLIKGNVAVGSITGIDFGVTTTSSGSFTGNIFKANNVVTTTSTASDTGNFLNLSRSDVASGASTVVTVTGDVATISSTCSTASSGTCNDSANVLSLAQNYTSASGAVLDLTNAGTGQGVLLTSSSTGDLMELDSSGAVTTANGLVIAATNGSGVITDALDVSDAEIVNAVNAGANVILGTTASIDFSNFDVATTGNITVAAGQGLDTNGAGALALGNTNATSVSICNSTACDTISLGTNADADTITLGDSTDTVGINGATTILGATAINTSGSSNTNIGTGTSTGTITIGLSSGTDLALADANWNVTGAGAANFVSIGATTRGTALFTTLGTNGNVTIGDANTDTLTINAGSSGTGISFGDSSFTTCTALTTVAGVLTCGSAGGSMSSFTAAGDSGSNQTISDSNTLTIAGGTNGIDTVGSATDTITLNLDTTEITNATFGAGSGYTWTFDAGATDPTIAFASNQITIGSAATLTATGVTTFDCTDCINFDDMADSMTLDASTSIATGNSLGLTVTSDLSGGARSTDAFIISQANDASNNSTGNLLQLTNSDTASTTALLDIAQAATAGTGVNFTAGITTGIGIDLTSLLVTSGKAIDVTASTITSGSALRLANSMGTNGSATFNGKILDISPTHTEIGAATFTHSGNYLNVARADSATTNASAVMAITGDLVSFTSTCTTANSATCTDSSNILSIAQNYTSATGALVDLTNAGTGQGVLLTSSSTGDLMELDSSGAVTTANGLVIAATHASGVITDALDVSDAEIVNAVNAGANVILGTTASIDFSNFDVATTGNITVAAGVGIDTNASGILTVGNTTATTVNIGGTAATAINLGAGGALTRTIAIGTGTGADTINIGTGGTTADTITIGNNASTTSLALTSGTGSQTFTSSNATGSTTSGSFVFTDNSLTTGTGTYLNSSSLTSGNLLSLASTSTALTSGKLGSFDWSPGSATTATGDLFNINIGTNGTTTANIFSVSDTGSNLFSVSETGITANVPAAFNAAGDVTMAYDLQFTNQTASFIKALGPLTIDAGESFESNDLTLKTYNSGRVVADVSNTGGLLISSNPSSVSSIGLLNVDGAATGKALAVFNESGDQNILTASASGTTVANIGRTGAISVAAGQGVDTLAAGILALGNTTATTVNIGGTAATAINLGAGGALTRTIAIGTGTGSDTINIGTGGTAADTITIGNNASTTSLALTSGTGAQTFTSSNATGATTSSSFVFTDNALTTGTGAYLNSSSLTSGNLLSLASTSTVLTSGKLASFDWSPGSATTATGDLFNINIGTNGTTTGNIFSVSDTASNLFSVSETQITSALPHQFTAAGDVAVAYDLQFTNQTASFIKSNAPLTLDTGEIFESNSLTLQTYNLGNILLNTGTSSTGTGKVAIGPSVTPQGLLHVSNTSESSLIGKALAIFDQAESQDILSASKSGTPKFVVDSGGIPYMGSNASAGANTAACWNSATLNGATLYKIGDCPGTPADIAEWYAADTNVQPGDAVSISLQGFTYEAQGADPYTHQESSLGTRHTNVLKKAEPGEHVIGIISTGAFQTFGEDIKNAVDESGRNDIKPVPLALTGRVPANVDTSGTSITAGDKLMVSNTGKIAKANGTGTTLGTALESWSSGSDVNQIMVLVSEGFTADGFENGNTATDSALVGVINTRLTSIESDFNSLVRTALTASDSGILASFDKVNTNTLNVLGDTVLSDTVINGKLNIGAIQIDNTTNSIDAIGTLRIQSLALANIEFENGKIVFDTNGNVTVNTISAQKYKVSGASAGTDSIAVGTTEIFINTDAVSANSLIFVTPKQTLSAPLAVTEKIEGTGFKVTLSQSESTLIDFDWFIIDKE